MQVISQQHLQRVLARLERYFGLCAAVPEVDVLGVLGYWQGQIGQARIDQEVVVARVRGGVSSRDDFHAFDAKDHPDRIADRVTVRRAYEKHVCAGNRGGARKRGGFRVISGGRNTGWLRWFATTSGDEQ
jgi:hypothetical protein